MGKWGGRDGTGEGVGRNLKSPLSWEGDGLPLSARFLEFCKRDWRIWMRVELCFGGVGAS